MKLLEIYQYLFYKLYKFYELNESFKWGSDWKAIGSMIVLELIAFNSLKVYYHYFTGYAIESTTGLLEPYQIILLLILVGLNYYIFNYQSKWKKIIIEFDKLPKKTNKIGGFIVYPIFIIIIIIYFSTLDLMSKLNYN